MAFYADKAHVQLNGCSYQIAGYSRSDLSTFIPRLSSGDQEASDFDVLKAKVINTFTGGELQRKWDDDTSYYGGASLYPIYDDGVLFPVGDVTEHSTALGNGWGKGIITAQNEGLYAYLSYNGTPYTYLYYKDGTAVTLPAGLQASTVGIYDIALVEGNIYVSADTGLYTMAYGAITLTTVSTSAGYKYRRMVGFNGKLYGTSNGTTVLYSYTGSTTTASHVVAGKTGRYDGDYTARLFVYNNRVFLQRDDGLWAYDGVQLVSVEQDGLYKFACVLKGYIYYLKEDGMYRFNGSLIEKLYDISEVGSPIDMRVANGALWLLYKNGDGESSRFDKTMGDDLTSTTDTSGRLVCFDGNGFYTYARFTAYSKPASPDLTGQSEVYSLLPIGDVMQVRTYYPKGGEGFEVDISEVIAATNDDPKSWDWVSSVFDADFPMVQKHLENVELVFDGTLVAGEDITVQYRVDGFDGSGSWVNAGTIETQAAEPQGLLPMIDAEFTNVQIRLSGTTTRTYGIKRVILRYLLVPNYKNQWKFTAMCYGGDRYAPLLNADNTDETTATVMELRSNIYAARDSKSPVHFVDIDYLRLTADIDDVATTATFQNIAMLKGESGFLLIGSEIVQWVEKIDDDTLRLVRGALGTTASAHLSYYLPEAYVLYRVLVRQILNERVEMPDPATGRPPVDRPLGAQFESEITLVLNEV